MSQSTTVNITNINNYQAAATAVGLGPIPAGITPDALVQKFLTQLQTNLQNTWPAAHGPYPGTLGNVATGIMQPWSANYAGQAVPCAINEITSSFNNWGLPVDTATISDMVEEITTQISLNAGLAGTQFGLKRIGAATIYWGVAYITMPVIDNPLTNGIGFAFAANAM